MHAFWIIRMTSLWNIGMKNPNRMVQEIVPFLPCSVLFEFRILIRNNCVFTCQFSDFLICCVAAVTFLFLIFSPSCSEGSHCKTCTKMNGWLLGSFLSSWPSNPMMWISFHDKCKSVKISINHHYTMITWGKISWFCLFLCIYLKFPIPQ